MMAWLRLIAIPLLVLSAVAAGACLRILPAPLSRRISPLLNQRLCRAACRALRVTVSYDGALPVERPALLVANHVSWTDVIAFGSLIPIRFLARHDMAHWPGLGLLARLFGTLFVERGRLRQIPRVNAQMAERMGAGDLVALFPEATTGDGTRLKRFHAVHFAAARKLLQDRPELESVAIAPAAIVYSRRRGVPLGRSERAAIAWYGDADFMPHVLDLVRGGGVECRVSFLTPLRFTSASDRKAVARETRVAVRAEVVRLLSSTTVDSGRTYGPSAFQGV